MSSADTSFTLTWLFVQQRCPPAIKGMGRLGCAQPPGSKHDRPAHGAWEKALLHHGRIVSTKISSQIQGI